MARRDVILSEAKNLLRRYGKSLNHGEQGKMTENTERSECRPSSVHLDMFLFNCTPPEFV
jgi:hypothetical protein